jgi:hypothetical protein
MAVAKDSEGESELPEVRTDPPPPGEDDPYDAATRVGPMSANAIAKMMRDTEVPASSGLRSSSLPRNTPVPAVAPDVSALFNEAPGGPQESDTGIRDERARDLQDLQKRASPATSTAPSPPGAATTTSAPPPAGAAPRAPIPFPEWLQTSTHDEEEDRNAERRQLLFRGVALAVVVALVTGLIVWWLAH